MNFTLLCLSVLEARKNLYESTIDPVSCGQAVDPGFDGFAIRLDGNTVPFILLQRFANGAMRVEPKRVNPLGISLAVDAAGPSALAIEHRCEAFHFALRTEDSIERLLGFMLRAEQDAAVAIDYPFQFGCKNEVSVVAQSRQVSAGRTFYARADNTVCASFKRCNSRRALSSC